MARNGFRSDDAEELGDSGGRDRLRMRLRYVGDYFDKCLNHNNAM